MIFTPLLPHPWKRLLTLQSLVYVAVHKNTILKFNIQINSPGIHCEITPMWMPQNHDDVIKWKDFPRYWPFVSGIHRSPVDSPHKGQWRGALMLSLICASTAGLANNRYAGDLRRLHAHYDVTVMTSRTRSQHWCREWFGAVIIVCIFSGIYYNSSGMTTSNIRHHDIETLSASLVVCELDKRPVMRSLSVSVGVSL